jgi:hypothetical protein
VTDKALISKLAETVLWPRNLPEFALNGVVSLRTNYQGDSWTYLAARLGPRINGERQHFAVWVLSDGGSPVGIQLGAEDNGDDTIETEWGLDAAFSVVAETGPYFWNDDRTRVALCALDAPGATTVSTRMTLPQYEQLRPSTTTLDQLRALVGDRACEESSETTLAGITTLGLTCQGEGQPGANAVLIFQDGVLVSKGLSHVASFL